MKLPFMNPLDLIKKKPASAQADGAPEAKEAEKLKTGMISIKDIVSPPATEIDFDHVKIGDTFFRTLFMSGYPRYVGANWLAPLINFDESLDFSALI